MIGFAERTLRYGIVGLAVSVAYSVAVVLAVHSLPTHNATLASGIVFAVMLPIAYLAHRSIAFFDAAPDPFQPLRFAVSTASTFLIAVGGMYAVTEILGRSYLLGIALSWALIPPTNFLIYLFWVFRVGPRRPAAVPTGVGAAPETERSILSEAPTIANGFVKVGDVAELGAAGQFSRWVGNHDILVYRHNGTIRGLSNICPHFGGPVGYYQLRDGKFTCLWHNLQFDADSGRCLGFPKLRLREYKIIVQEGEIYAQLVEEEPATTVDAATPPPPPGKRNRGFVFGPTSI
jgi:nitrite reductase/ring-hydroxylating ferredoxin subunit/putative flippase GtrA